MMQFKFDPNQPFQLDAIQAITDLFHGQARLEAAPQFSLGSSALAAVPNQLELEADEILANLQAIQARNGITPDTELKTISADISTANGENTCQFYNFSVEMETGTGKTYVYLRTALELYQQYGLRKFIIVVPSVAIREGVIKTLEITKKHFEALYGNLPINSYEYDSGNLTQVRGFALSNSIEIMVMTLASFNKDLNVIYQSTDRLQGETPVHLIQVTRPVLILDEPQNMESDKSIDSLASLNPLMTLRYSATHRNPYNIVYRLTPFEAYRQNLVKRIEVYSITKEDDQAKPYIRLESVNSDKRSVTARVIIHQRQANGSLKEKSITIKPGDDLQQKAKRVEYQGYVVDEIEPFRKAVVFTNREIIFEGMEIGADKEDIFEAQIAQTVEEHFKKQAWLKPYGLKVLSLFFIDRVANYQAEDGKPGPIQETFNRVFNRIKANYPDWKNADPNQVKAAYFAQKKVKGELQFKDSSSGDSQDDKAVYDLIMKDKEQLLSFEEPVGFIFSHSALKEGWDNPNVFQICTLNQTVSDVKKRQEIGRGIRLAVNQAGERDHNPQVNILTVIANESYDRFVTSLQSEIALEYIEEIEARYGKPIGKLTEQERAQIAEEYGAEILPPRPTNANQRVKVSLKKGFELDPNFKELWERIKHKTRYAVKVNTEQLIQDVLKNIGRVEVKPPRLVMSKVALDVKDDDNLFQALVKSQAKSLKSLQDRYPLPNLVELMSERMKQLNPPVRLTRRTLLEIIRRAPEKAQQAMLENPQEFAIQAVKIIQEKLSDQLIEGIQYEKITDWYEMTQFESEFDSWQNYLVPSRKSPYDHIKYDSEIEKQFVEDMEHLEQVLYYVKLPGWFKVDTPIGTYNPDWAIVWKEGELESSDPVLYLVRETKGTTSAGGLRGDEKKKITCGEHHFEDALKVDYKVVTSAKELP